jgi:hypothetical protein
VFLPWISVVFDVSKQGDLGQLVCGSRPAPDQLNFDIFEEHFLGGIIMAFSRIAH